MKKLVLILSLVLCLCIGIGVLSGCGGEKNIMVVSRESGSGTRDAFDGLIKNADGDSLNKKADGTVYDGVLSTADIQNSTGNVMTKVASVKTGIGYISLGSLNNTVKSVKVGGIAVSQENVLNGSYKLQRPFIIATNKNTTLTTATQDFINYLESSQAQLIVTANKYVTQASQTQYIAPTTAVSGTVIIKGSTSVDALMDKLIADYKLKGGANVSGVSFSKDAQGSSQGISAVKSDSSGVVIGMSSSNIKEQDKDTLNYFNVALDAVAVIVHNSNTLTDISIEQLFNVYTGKIKKFSGLE